MASRAYAPNRMLVGHVELCRAVLALLGGDHDSGGVLMRKLLISLDVAPASLQPGARAVRGRAMACLAWAPEEPTRRLRMARQALRTLGT